MAAEVTRFTFCFDSRALEALGLSRPGELLGRKVGVPWGDHEASAEVETIRGADDGLGLELTVAIHGAPFTAEMLGSRLSIVTGE